MSEQADNTTEHDEASRKERGPKPASYYYDDATGYEIYDPSKDEDSEDEDSEAETEDTPRRQP
jgi:hypothetical protein